MGRYKALFVDNFKVWEISSQVRQEIRARAKSGPVSENGWGHGPVIKSIIKQPVLGSIVKQFDAILEQIRGPKTFREREKTPNMSDDDDIDALFQDDDELFPDMIIEKIYNKLPSKYCFSLFYARWKSK